MKIGKSIKPGTVVVEAGLPKDRLKGYRDDHTTFTGADARAALVGDYGRKNKKKGFSRKSKSY
jgi:hypothetical protein